MNAADRRRLTPMLGMAAGVLVLLLIVLWAGVARGVHWQDDASPPKLPRVSATTPPPEAPALTKYNAVWQHPLFSPTRTPALTGGGESGRNLQLTGVILLPGLNMAILRDKTTNKTYRVVEGQRPRNKPTLLKLHPRTAVVAVSGSRVQLKLVPGPSPGASSATVPGSDTIDRQPGAGDGAHGKAPPRRARQAGTQQDGGDR